MNQFIQFASRHWPLFLGLVITIILIFIVELRERKMGIRKISPQESVSLINKQNALIIDIRSKEAYLEGHIANAKNLPKEDNENYANKLSENKSHPIILTCYAGVSSLKVAEELKKQGFDNVYSLAGGMNGWKAAGLPIVKETK